MRKVTLQKRELEKMLHFLAKTSRQKGWGAEGLLLAAGCCLGLVRNSDLDTQREKHVKQPLHKEHVELVGAIMENDRLAATYFIESVAASILTDGYDSRYESRVSCDVGRPTDERFTIVTDSVEGFRRKSNDSHNSEQEEQP